MPSRIMNNNSSRVLVRGATVLLIVGGLAFFVWQFVLRDRRGDRQFAAFSFNWGNSGQDNVVPGFDLGAVEILSLDQILVEKVERHSI